MKKFIASITLILTVFIASAQNYEAATWKPWLVSNPEKIITKAPPTTAQSKQELQQVKKQLSATDAKKKESIIYWNAGAPSYRWNQIAAKMLNEKQELMLRMPSSWVNIAIYDATIIAWKEKGQYKRKRPAQTDPSIKTIVDGPLTYSYPCEHSVTAAAAATMLAYFFPAKADSVLQLAHAASQSRVDAGLQYPSDIEEGWRIGEQVAKEIIEKAKNDGSAAEWKGTMNKDPKKWTGNYPMGIALAKFTTLVLKSPDQFRPGPPPDFENDMKELKEFKQSPRSKYQAHFWANNGGVDFWTEVASQKLFEYRMMDDAPAASRIFTILNTAYHDAAIAIFDAKYTYWGIRPVQYDSTYKPQIATPPFPGYPSGHALGGGTTCAVLSYFFPADAKYFNKLAQDCADSRFYAGIHFRTDNEVGLQMGKAIGKYVVETWLNKSY